MFQNSALISNMTVEQNIAVPLRYHTTLGDAEIREKARFWCDRLLLSGHEGKRPALLSIGMQRRAAVARAMCMEPRLLFMDEPLSGLRAEASCGPILALSSDIKGSLFPDVVEGPVDMPDGVDACLFLDDIGRRRKGNRWIDGGYVDGRDAELPELPDVFRGEGAALDEVAAAEMIEDALGNDHAFLEVFDR